MSKLKQIYGSSMTSIFLRCVHGPTYITNFSHLIFSNIFLNHLLFICPLFNEYLTYILYILGTGDSMANLTNRIQTLSHMGPLNLCIYVSHLTGRQFLWSFVCLFTSQFLIKIYTLDHLWASYWMVHYSIPIIFYLKTVFDFLSSSSKLFIYIFV